MLLNDFISDALLNAVPYISDNMPDYIDVLYYYIRYTFGERTVNPLAEVMESDLSTLGRIINLKFIDKWSTLKKIADADYSVTGKEDTETKQTDNSIYGYNGDSAKDYTKTETTTKHSDFDDIYKKLSELIDTKTKFSYYYIIATDIAYFLTLSVYE